MKNKTVLKISALFSVLFLLFSSFTVYGEPNNSSITDAIYKIIDFEKSDSTYKNSYIFNTDFLKNAQEHDSIRLLVSLSRFGYEDNYKGYGAILKDTVVRSYKTFDKLSPDKSTPWHIISMGLMACGINPQDIKSENGTIDLIKDGIWARNKKTPLEKDGPEALMRGLITMDAYTTLIPDNANPNYDRNVLIQTIMTYQKENGNFSTSSVISDPEITATAVTALAPYQHLDTVFGYTRISDKRKYSNTVGDIIYKALEYLSLNQSEDGSFSDFGKDNVRITSRTLIALCSLGIDPLSDARFIKNDNTLVSALLSLQNEDGSVSGNSEEKRVKADTVYALEALVAYNRFLNGETSLYNFTDCNFSDISKSTTKPDLKRAYEYYVLSDTFSSVDSYEYLVMLIDWAESSELSEEDSLYLDGLKEKATTLYNKKIKLNELNEQGKELSAPQTVLGSKNSHAINLFIKQYNSLSVYDKQKITSYGSVIEKKSSVRSKTTAGYVLTITIGIILIALILFLAVFFIRSTPVWDYIYMKFFGSMGMVEDDEFEDDEFDMNFDTAFFVESGDEAPLPYVGNDDFFRYGDPGDIAEVDEEIPYIENDEFLDFISRDKNGEDSEDEIEVIQSDEQQLPYVNNDEFFEYDYPTEDMAVDQDDDFKIY